MFDHRRSTALRHLARPDRSFRVLFALLTLLFVAVLLYQATWQLTGVLRPEFIAFMQLHDRRQFNPAHLIQRGRILDQRGEVLAYSRERDGRVERSYPFGPAFAHVVGYRDPRFGSAGIEAAANVYLNGGALEDLAGWGELGRRILTQDKRLRGQDLRLTLDAELQQQAFQLLGDRRGAVVLLRPEDGAVRVLASAPSFEPGRVAPELFQAAGPDSPLLNRATQGLYPPGSTFKVVLAAQALNKGFKGTLHCPAEGFTTSSRYPRIRDHDFYTARDEGRTWKGYGNLDLTTAFTESSNVFFAQLGVLQGHESFLQTARDFYFDQTVPLYESPFGGWILHTGPLPLLKPSDQYGLAQMSIGQGRLVTTPAHLALIVAAVANGGLAMRPRLVESDPPEAFARFMSAATARRLAQMMRRVVTEGTGRGINTPDLAIAGKTGTAQNPSGPAHSWFIGFAPADAPALAVAVLVEHGGYGSRAAAPIARDLLLRARKLGLLQ